ncbi:TPA: LysR family transcriptional regulator [Burkholderia multivorans]|nr:LysR family transcriptional regulator [Burkholderia multivorans]MBU9184574.1 LysR family transcriptional regulator [Burkholderia multivorans]MBU9206493.1 LysR family transcriptional regulator [Burkholderia multivorans]MBU9692697.1 LysR family transcriptional regulator [Burkholderia multivorans]PRE27852.1 LysR family transcriptional regulator [Burkholderia multivorans]
MTLAQLQALAAVVELGSLTAAADRLNRSRSAIGHAHRAGTAQPGIRPLSYAVM